VGGRVERSRPVERQKSRAAFLANEYFRERAGGVCHLFS
jgi:hypothetical protein